MLSARPVRTIIYNIRMKKRILPLCLLFGLLFGLAACEEETGEIDEYAGWREKNEAAFADTLARVRTIVAEAQATYGDQWEEHCRWRLFRTYTLPEGAAAESTDTICVEIVEKGEGSGPPLYTDSVRVNYQLRELPTASYPEGRVQDHSGYSERTEEIFSAELGIPATLRVSNTVDGFTTALMHMHIGDRWRIYVPWQLGYGASTVQQLHGYSMLRFDVQLKAYYRAGVTPPAWLAPKK